MSAGTVEAARLQAIVEVLNAQKAAQDLRNFGQEVNRAGQQSQSATTGLAALDRHAKTAHERAQIAGQKFKEMSTAVEGTGSASKAAAAEVEKVARAADSAGKAAEQSSGSQSILSRALGDVNAKSLLATAGIASVGVMAINTGKQAIAAGMDYETAFAGVRKTVDATEAELASLSQGIRNMATEIPVAATELAGIAGAAGQLNIANEHILEFTRTIADLGVATDLSGEQAAMSLARFINITGTAQGEISNLASGIAFLGSTTASTESQIMDMAMRLASAGRTIGLTDGQVLGLSATLSSLGLAAEAGGNNMSRVLLEINTAVDLAGDKLNTLAEIAGMSAEQFAEAWRTSPDEALQAFIAGIDEFEAAGGNVSILFQELELNGIRVGDVLRRSASGADLLRVNMEGASQAIVDNNALTNEANEFYSTAANRLEVAKNRINDVALELYEAYGPAMADAIEITSGLIEEIGKIPRVVNIAVNFVRGGDGLDPQELPGSFEYGGVEIPISFVPATGADSGLWDLMKPGLGIVTGVTQLGLLGDAIVYVDESVKDMNSSMSSQQVADYATAIERSIAIVNDAGGFEPLFTEEDQLWAERVGKAYEETGRIAASVAQGIQLSDVPFGPDPSEVAGVFDAATQALQRQEEQLGQVAIGYRATSGEVDAFRDALERGGPDAVTRNIATLVAGIADGKLAYRDFADFVTQEATPEMIDAVDKLRVELERDLFNAMGDPEKMAEAEARIAVLNKLYGDQAGEINGVTAAMSELASAQDLVNRYIDETSNALKHWERSADDVSDAINYLLDIEERQGYLTADQMRQYEELIWYQDRLSGGIENDLVPAYIDAQVKAAEYTRVQDELNQMLADNIITEEQHRDMLLDAALAADAGSLAQAGLAEANQTTAEMIDRVIDRIQNMLEEIGLIPSEVEMRVDLDTSEAERAVDAFRAHVANNPATIDLYVNQVNAIGFTEAEPGGIIDRSLQSTPAPTSSGGGQFHTGRDRAAEAEAEKAAAAAAREASQAATKAANDAQREAEQAAREAQREAERAAQEAERAAEAAARFTAGILTDIERRLDPSYISDLEDQLASLAQAREIAIETGQGERVVAALDTEIAALEAELELIGEFAGTAIGQGITEAIRQAEATQAMADLLGDLEGIVDGSTGTALGEKLVELLQLQRVAEQMGDLDLAAMYQEQIDAVSADLERLGLALSTPIVQGMIDGFEAERMAEEWGDRISSALSGPSFAEKVMDDLEAISRQIDLGKILGAPSDLIAEWEQDKADLTRQGQVFWTDVAMAAAAGLIDPAVLKEYADAGGAMFREIFDSIAGPGALDALIGPVGISDGALASIGALFDPKSSLYAFGEGASGATKHVEGLAKAVTEGRLEVEQFYDLLGNAARKDVLPVLQQLEQQYHGQWIAAVVAGNDEAAASIKEVLDLLARAREDVDKGVVKGKQAPGSQIIWNQLGMTKAEWLATGMSVNETLAMIEENKKKAEPAIEQAFEETGALAATSFSHGAVEGLVNAGIDWDAVLADATGATESGFAAGALAGDAFKEAFESAIDHIEISTLPAFTLDPSMFQLDTTGAITAEVDTQALATAIQAGVGAAFRLLTIQSEINVDVGRDRLVTIVADIIKQIYRQEM